MTTQTLPKNWVRSKVSKAATVVMGQSPDSRLVNEEQAGIPFLQGNAEFTEKYPVPIHWVTKPTKLSEKGDILISVRAPVGEINIADKEYCIGRGLAAIRFRKIDNQFGWYAIAYHKNQLVKLAQGSTFTAVSSKDFSDFEIIHPNNPEEQRAIADILSTVDEAIAQSESLVRKYQSIKQGLMSDLLTRGVDGNGELRPTREEAPGLYRESPLGWLPKDWGMKKIGEAFELILGKMLSKASKKEISPFPYLANRNVQWERLDLSDLDTMDFSDAEREKLKLLPEDLLVCEGGEVGRTAIWMDEMDDCYFQKAIHRLRSKDRSILPKFMLRYMRFAAQTGLFTNFISQTSISHLTQEKLKTLHVICPSTEEQERIIEIFENQDDLLAQEESALKKLYLLKQGLMQDLLSGQVRVKM
ncbi:MAG: restriction endonuclease subunit S [Chloroflexi bacterium]|nr:restriction endonuclease subunit S [Chloroflexota bacterium]